jgi:hypothetical protein
MHIRCDVTGRSAAALAALLVCLPPPADVLAEASIYRCVAADGSIEFRQHQCHQSDTSSEIEIEDNLTGWTPPSGDTPAKAARGASTKKKARPEVEEPRDKYADRCWNKRQQLERVNTQLRAGYTAAQGVKLRRRRTEYEAYIRHYCR